MHAAGWGHAPLPRRPGLSPDPPCCLAPRPPRQVPVVVAAYAGSPELPAAVEAAVRAQQSSDAAVQYGLAAARLLERVVLGSTVREVRRGGGGVGRRAAREKVPPARLPRRGSNRLHTRARPLPTHQAIKWATTAAEVPEPVRPVIAAAAAAASSPVPFNALAADFGVSCAMPGALQAALVAAARADSYEGGVRVNMLAGGDNASRACYLGALLGAAFGGPPADWAAEVTGYAGFEAAASRVAGKHA
jgi:hypothetical protein